MTPAGKRQVTIFYGWLALITVGLLLVYAHGQDAQSAQIRRDIQNQRAHSIRLACERQDRKHVTLFHENRAKLTVAEADGNARAVGAARERETLLATLEPWEDCDALVRERVH